jgi:hypothetical protein
MKIYNKTIETEYSMRAKPIVEMNMKQRKNVLVSTVSVTTKMLRITSVRWMLVFLCLVTVSSCSMIQVNEAR